MLPRAANSSPDLSFFSVSRGEMKGFADEAHHVERLASF
jgi:hypothetical protein